MSDSATEYDKLFIGGKWTKPSTSDVIEVRCPATGEYVGKVPMAAAADVDAAVAAARAAFDNGPWPSTPPHERAAVIAAAVKMLAERRTCSPSCSQPKPASRRPSSRRCTGWVRWGR